MQKYVNNCIDPQGNAIATVTVTVKIAGTDTLASLFLDNGVTPRPENPFSSDSDGTFYFYAANGRYDVVLTKTGFSFPAIQTSDILLDDPAEVTAQALAGYRYGVELSNDAGDATNDIDIATGEAMSDDALPENRVIIFQATDPLIKKLDVAWAEGTNQGGRDTGAIADTTYFVFLIFNPSTGVTDALFSASPTTPIMPTGYTKKRRIGCILREAGTIAPFVQKDTRFMRSVIILDADTTNPGTDPILEVLSVPIGIKVLAVVSATINGAHATQARILITDPANAAMEPAAVGGQALQAVAGSSSSGEAMSVVGTNASGQVRYEVNFSDANVRINITTHGWYDYTL